MKTFLMAALAVAAVGANVVFAEEDDGIVSAAPVIADPVNPQPGMLCTAYCHGDVSGSDRWSRMLPTLEKAPSVRTYVDKGAAFTRTGVEKSLQTNVLKWEGFIKCKRSATYAFTLTSIYDEDRIGGEQYYFAVNGKEIAKCGDHQNTYSADLKIGWNKVVVIFECDDAGKRVDIKYRPNGSTSDPRPLTPGVLYHDEKPEEEW